MDSFQELNHFGLQMGGFWYFTLQSTILYVETTP